jgi:hypothetical protein
MGTIEPCNTHDMSTRKLYSTLTCYDDQRATEYDFNESTVLEGSPSLLNFRPENFYGDIHLESVGEQDGHRDDKLHRLGQTADRRVFSGNGI